MLLNRRKYSHVLGTCLVSLNSAAARTVRPTQNYSRSEYSPFGFLLLIFILCLILHPLRRHPGMKKPLFFWLSVSNHFSFRNFRSYCYVRMLCVRMNSRRHLPYDTNSWLFCTISMGYLPICMIIHSQPKHKI